MKRAMCAVFDSGVMAFGAPFFARALGEALRSFTDEVNRKAPDNMLNAHSDDYALHLLGWFDDEQGTVDASDKRVLCRGKDVLREVQS